MEQRKTAGIKRQSEILCCMKYYIKNKTLFLRGNFRAVSSGAGGGLSNVSTIINRTVEKNFLHDSPEKFIEEIVREEGCTGNFFGLLTAVDMKTLCVMINRTITVFITAGVSNPNPKNPKLPGTINIIVHSRDGLFDEAMAGLIITATEAKTEALFSMGYDFAGTTTDAVAACCSRESKKVHRYAGRMTDIGRWTAEAVLFGVQEAIARHEGKKPAEKPALYILSTIGGDHWIEWSPEGCLYYPCHFRGQVCKYCYCPFYPCNDEELGYFVETSAGGTVWACTTCILMHHPEIVDHMKKYPMATISELKKVAEVKNLKINAETEK
jgi:adenosylcobinamide hydrolase